MEKEDQKHHNHNQQQLLQLLPPPTPPPPLPPLYHPSSSSSQWNHFAEPSTSSKRTHLCPSNKPYSHRHHQHQHETPLDLQLSISLQSSTDCLLGPGDRPIKQQRPPEQPPRPNHHVEAIKWQAAEQIRLAAMEKAYAEQVREMTRKEMELAQAEFVRARMVWERAREELGRVERLKESSTKQTDNSCMEITCYSCRQRFRP